MTEHVKPAVITTLRIFTNSGQVFEIQTDVPVTYAAFGTLVNNLRAANYFMWADPYCYVPAENIAMITLTEDATSMKVVDMRNPTAEPTRMN